MTPRERKYHDTAKFVKRHLKNIKALQRQYFYVDKDGVKAASEPKSCTITITKYNLYQNRNLQQGQLN